jgi:hypothetical protein
MYAENEILFPYNVIPTLRRVRGEKFQALVERVMAGSQLHDETLAFMLMMVRLNGCISCETDSFRAMKGCAACAMQTLRRYKGDDDELIAQFEQALAEIRDYAHRFPHWGIQAIPLMPRPRSV